MVTVLLIVIVILIMPFLLDARSSDRVNKLPNRKINYHWMRKKHTFPRKILSLFFSLAYLNCWFWKRHRLDNVGSGCLFSQTFSSWFATSLIKNLQGIWKLIIIARRMFSSFSPYSKFSFPEDEPFRRTKLSIKIQKRVDKLFGVILP